MLQTINKELLLKAAKLSSAVYEEDPAEMQKQMEALGYTFLGLVTDGKGTDQGDHQVAVLRAPDKRNVLVCRGTQVEDHFSLSELLDDNDTTLLPTNTFKGFTMPESMLEEIDRLVDHKQSLDVYGHSKGGSESHILATQADYGMPVRAVSFGAPACANEFYYQSLFMVDRIELYRVIAEGDFAPGWGLDSNGYQPIPAVLLAEGKEPEWTTTEHYKTLLEGGLKAHSITDSYIRLLSE